MNRDYRDLVGTGLALCLWLALLGASVSLVFAVSLIVWVLAL